MKFTGMSYYGSTTCIMRRINTHKEQILNRTHENTALRRALATNPSLGRFS